MAVRDWTRGQVVVLWCALIAVTLLIAVGAAILMGEDVSVVPLMCALVFAVGCLPGLAVTWFWLGGRRSK